MTFLKFKVRRQLIVVSVFFFHWQLSGSAIGQSASQLPSLVQLQQKNEVHIDDRSKAPSVPSNEAKPLLPSLSTSSVDVSVIPKVMPFSFFFLLCVWEEFLFHLASYSCRILALQLLHQPRLDLLVHLVEPLQQVIFSPLTLITIFVKYDR